LEGAENALSRVVIASKFQDTENGQILISWSQKIMLAFPFQKWFGISQRLMF